MRPSKNLTHAQQSRRLLKAEDRSRSIKEVKKYSAVQYTKTKYPKKIRPSNNDKHSKFHLDDVYDTDQAKKDIIDEFHDWWYDDAFDHIEEQICTFPTLISSIYWYELDHSWYFEMSPKAQTAVLYHTTTAIEKRRKYFVVVSGNLSNREVLCTSSNICLVVDMEWTASDWYKYTEAVNIDNQRHACEFDWEWLESDRLESDRLESDRLESDRLESDRSSCKRDVNIDLGYIYFI
jgi:hypothetical protein